VTTHTNAHNVKKEVISENSDINGGVKWWHKISIHKQKNAVSVIALCDDTRR